MTSRKKVENHVALIVIGRHAGQGRPPSSYGLLPA